MPVSDTLSRCRRDGIRRGAQSRSGLLAIISFRGRTSNLKNMLFIAASLVLLLTAAATSADAFNTQEPCRPGGNFRRLFTVHSPETRMGRRARQSCLNDFETLCFTDTNTDGAPTVAISASAAAAAGGGGTLPLPSSVVRRRRRRRIGAAGRSFYGLEACLTALRSRVRSPTCRAFLDSRAVCFAEAENAESGLLCKVGGASPPAAAAGTLSPPPPLQTATWGGFESAGEGTDAAPSDMSDRSVPYSAEDAARDRATAACLRRESEQLSAQCVNSTYFYSIAPRKPMLMKAAEGKESSGGRQVLIPALG